MGHPSRRGFLAGVDAVAGVVPSAVDDAALQFFMLFQASHFDTELGTKQSEIVGPRRQDLTFEQSLPSS